MYWAQHMTCFVYLTNFLWEKLSKVSWTSYLLTWCNTIHTCLPMSQWTEKGKFIAWASRSLLCPRSFLQEYVGTLQLLELHCLKIFNHYKPLWFNQVAPFVSQRKFFFVVSQVGNPPSMAQNCNGSVDWLMSNFKHSL